MHWRATRSFSIGIKGLQLNCFVKIKTESQSRKEVFSSLCTSELWQLKVGGNWALYIFATSGHIKFDFSDDVINHVANEILGICQEANYPLQNKVERFGINNPDVQTMNGYWLWAVEVVQPSDTSHNCNLLNTIIVYDNCCEEEEPLYNDSESRLKDEIGVSFQMEV